MNDQHCMYPISVGDHGRCAYAFNDGSVCQFPPSHPMHDVGRDHLRHAYQPRVLEVCGRQERTMRHSTTPYMNGTKPTYPDIYHPFTPAPVSEAVTGGPQ